LPELVSKLGPVGLMPELQDFCSVKCLDKVDFERGKDYIIIGMVN